MKALVLAGGVAQIELIIELKARGYYTILVDYTEHPVAEEYADKFYRKSTLDIDAVRKIAKEEKTDLVITCCTDQALHTVSVIASELGLPCYVNDRVGLAVTNKQVMKRQFKDSHVPTAEFEVVERASESYLSCYPLVVKPIDCNSSKGVMKVCNYIEKELAIKDAVSLSRTHKAIVEEYIEGEELSVDVFVVGGRAKVLCVSVSEKIKDEHKFVIFKGRYPSGTSVIVELKIENMAQRIAEAFNLNNCPMLMQVLVRGDDIYVVEFSARTGGCIKHRLIELVSGVNVIKSTIDLFENKMPEICPKISDKYIVNEFVYCKKGVFDHVEGIQECVEEGLLREQYVLKVKGSKFEDVNSSGDRIAAIVYVADSYDDYVEKHNAVIDRIKVIDTCGNDIMRHDLLPKL